MYKSQQESFQQLTKKQNEINNRIAVITATIKKLYEDKCTGSLPETVFFNLLSDYTNEQTELEKQSKDTAMLLEQKQDNERDISHWLALVEKYERIETLTRPVVMELIDRITINETYDSGGKKNQEITVNYNFIGKIKQKPVKAS